MANKKVRIGTGKPPIYSSPDQLIIAIDKYLDNTDEDSLTITGLALSLDFESRQSLYDYEKKSEYSYIIKRARLIVENGYEKDIKQGRMSAIFPLKNMGWTDRQEINQNTNMNIQTTPKEIDTEDLKVMHEILSKYKTNKEE